MRVVIAVAILLMLGGEGRAQPARAADGAEAAFEKGRKLMAAKRHAEACAAFELSQRLDPQYGTEFNLAGCYAAQGKVAMAWKLYRELARSDSNAPRRARSGVLARQLAKRVPKLRIRVDPELAGQAGLKVTVDATDVTAVVGAEIPFDLGRHVIEAQLPGHRPFREPIELTAPGELREIEVALEREPAPPDGPGPGEPGGPGGIGGGVEGGVEGGVAAAARRVRLGKIAIAGGGAVLGFGLVAGWRALANRDASRELCNAELCPDRAGAEAKIDRARLWGNLSTVTVLVGAVGVAGGIYLWRTSRAKQVSVAPAVGAASASLILHGVF